MSLLTDWRKAAYETERTPRDNDLFWGNYFNIEKGIYSQILAQNGTPVTGTVKALAEKFETKIGIMTGFLDGINDSLKTPNPIEEMEEDTQVKIDLELETLYKNMVDCNADWLYNLPQWDKLIDEDRRKELYKEQKASGTIHKEDRKVGRNDPCPCGSGKKYKYCCGRN